MHVERTLDPAVLRWVGADVSGAGLGDDGDRHWRDEPEFAGVADVLEGVAVSGGTILVRVSAGEHWRRVAPVVDAGLRARVAELAVGRTNWLGESVGAPSVVAYDLAAVQQVVDRAAGAVAASHGGELVVTSGNEGVVSISLRGACDGCGDAPATIFGLIEPAVRSAFPELHSVVVASAGPPEAPVAVTLSRARNSGTACH